MMQEQWEEGRREMGECERVRRKVEESLMEMEALGKDGEFARGEALNGIGTGDSEAQERDDTQNLWRLIHELDHEVL